MYCDFFGLRCLPFEDRADPRFYFPTLDSEAILQATEDECQLGGRMNLILGESGTGKTLLARVLLRRLPATDHPVILSWPVGGMSDLLRETCKGFGVTLPATAQPRRYLVRLRRHLERIRRANHRSVLVIDQAENLSPEQLPQVSTLAELQYGGETLLSIVLCAQPPIRSQLDRPELSPLRQQLSGEHILTPLTLTQTQELIEHRIEVAGGADANLFEPPAIERIHTSSRGNPRLINHYADAALMAACEASIKRVTESVAIEVTTHDRQCRNTARARDVGLRSASQVAAGWTMAGPDPARQPGAGSSTHPEAMLRRLETAIARVEQLNAATEASLARVAALERHLTTLTVRADRMTAGATSGAAVREQVETHLEAARRAAMTAVAEQIETLERTLDEVRTKSATAVDEESAKLTRIIAGFRTQVAGLEELLITAGQVDEALQATAAHAEQQQGQLDSHLAAAGRTVRSLAEATVEASQRHHRLELATREAGRIEAGITGSTTSLAELQQRSAAAQTSLASTVEHGEQLETRLQASITRASELLQHGEPLLHDLFESARNAEQRLGDLEPKLESLHQTLQDVTARPAEILEAAAAQSAQLECVCTAVRKVFANLSTTSLEAVRQAGEFERIGQDAGERVARLQAETERAAVTLQEWVDEAVRVQSRLERLIREAPSIHETHPGETIRRVSRTIESGGRILGAGTAAVGHDAEAPALVASEPVSKPRTRAEEIAELIAEARAASEGTAALP